MLSRSAEPQVVDRHVHSESRMDDRSKSLTSLVRYSSGSQTQYSELSTSLKSRRGRGAKGLEPSYPTWGTTEVWDKT